jgi:signal transduction histidine kinase
MVAEELALRLKANSRNDGQLLLKLERTLKKLLLETNSILLLSKADSGLLKLSPLPLQIEQLVRECIEDFSVVFESAKTDLILSIAPDLPLVLVDPAVFPTVITNLLDNALKYGEHKKPVRVRIEPSASNVLIKVCSTGPELPLEDQKQLFNRYFRGSNAVGKAGSGLGLYLCKAIVRPHGGEILYKHEEGENMYIVSLPG